MQERGASGNVTPPPSVNESEAQEVRTGHHVGEGSHAKDATSGLQSKNEVFLIEIEILLVKTNLFNVSGTVIHKNGMTHITLLRRWNSFFQPPYHVSNPPHFPFCANLPGLLSRTSDIGILPSVQNPSRTHHKFCSEFQHPNNQSLQNPDSEFTPSPQHSSSTSSVLPCIRHSLKEILCHQ
jgi:hypothetical protein